MRTLTFREAIRESLAQRMRRSSVFLIGEDIGLYGGVYGVTKGLIEEFGPDRVIETPISEAGFTGASVGAAMTGMRPVAEVSLMDFTTVCMEMIANQAAKTSYMTDGAIRVPMVVRTMMGARARVGPQHAQSLHAWFMHIPGLQVVLPSTPYDAKGLMTHVLCQSDPVLFIEHLTLLDTSGPVPEDEYRLLFGQAEIRRPGRDVTVVAIGAMVSAALRAAETLAGRGISAEVIDPRTLTPLDSDTIIESVRRTGRLVAVDDGHRTAGVAAEIVARVAESVVLAVPAVRVTAPDTPVPFSPTLVEAYLPDVESIVRAVDGMLGRV